MIIIYYLFIIIIIYFKITYVMYNYWAGQKVLNHFSLIFKKKKKKPII